MRVKLHVGERRVAAVQLVDAHLASDPGKYLAALLLSLATMLHLELPHVNVLSKARVPRVVGCADEAFASTPVLVLMNYAREGSTRQLTSSPRPARTPQPHHHEPVPHLPMRWLANMTRSDALIGMLVQVHPVPCTQSSCRCFVQASLLFCYDSAAGIEI